MFTKSILTLDWTHAGGAERKGSPGPAKHRLETRLATRWLVTSQANTDAWGTSHDAWKFQGVLDVGGYLSSWQVTPYLYAVTQGSSYRV